MNLRRWWIAALAVAIAGGGVVVATSGGSLGCSSAAVPIAQVPTVFSPTTAAVVRTDAELQRLVAAIQGSGFGRVLGAVGYDQTHYLHTAALPDGFANWTADNAVIGFRSRPGVAQWGLRQSTDPQAWALLGSDFVNLDLRPGAPVQAVAYRADSGVVDWCADVGRPTRPGGPLSVAPGLSGSAWVVTAGPTLTHLGADGRVIGQRAIDDVDHGSFVKQVGSLVVVGGRASHLLTAPDPRYPSSPGPAVAALDASTLRPRWTWGRGVVAHVLGESDGLVVIEVVRSGGLSLVALDLTGRQRWMTPLPAGTTADMVLIKSWNTVLIRSDRSISAYDARTGSRRWVHPSPATFPDGFDLEAQPQIGTELLLGLTDALVAMHPDGRATRYPLPNVGTDFWPYEIAVSGRNDVVETNAGAVLVALRPQV